MPRTRTPNRGAQAQHNYAWRAREQHRRAVRQIWNSGIRTRAAVAAELNRLAVPSEDGRPWGVASAGRLLRQFGLGPVVLGQEHAEAIREDVIELWGMGVQVPEQLAVALDRKGVACPGGDRWTEHKAGRVLELLDGDWREDFGNVRLRRGDTIPEAYVIEVDQRAELGDVADLGEGDRGAGSPARDRGRGRDRGGGAGRASESRSAPQGRPDLTPTGAPAMRTAILLALAAAVSIGQPPPLWHTPRSPRCTARTAAGWP